MKTHRTPAIYVDSRNVLDHHFRGLDCNLRIRRSHLKHQPALFQVRAGPKGNLFVLFDKVKALDAVVPNTLASDDFLVNDLGSFVKLVLR